MPRRIRVTFSYEYLQHVESVAQGRIDRAKLYNRKPRGGQPPEKAAQNTREGCRAEGAVAQHFGLPYDPGPDPDEIDVGNTEQRGTPHNTGSLLGMNYDVDREKQDKIFILGITPLDQSFVWLSGWCWGYELLIPERWGEHFYKDRFCYRMYQSELKDMRRLICVDDEIIERPTDQASLF